MTGSSVLRHAKRALGIIWFVLFVFSYSVCYLHNTILVGSPQLSFFDPYIYYCVDLARLFACLCLIVNFCSQWGKVDSKRLISVYLFKLAMLTGLMLYMHFGVEDHKTPPLLLMLFFALSADEQDENRLFSTGFGLGAAYTAILFILAMLGLMENNRGTAFGFQYRDNLGCYMLCLSLFYCILRDGWLTWLGELALLALPFVCLKCNDSKTAFVCGLILAACTMYRHYGRIGGAPYQDRDRFGPVIPLLFSVIYCPIALVKGAVERLKLRRGKGALRFFIRNGYILCGGLFILASATYRQFSPLWEKIPGIGTILSRFNLGQLGFEQFPVRWFGNQIPQIGLGGNEAAQPLYFVFDSSYIKTLLQYGALIFIVVIVLMTWTQYRLQKHHRYYVSFLLFLFALDSTMEFQLTNFVYNLFILLAFCKYSDKPGVEACERKSLLPTGKARRIALAGAFTALLAVLVLWCATAWQVSNWRGYTPHYAATVVVPGAYMDEVKSEALHRPRLTRAMRYLNSHKDARCIVDNEQDRDWLVAQAVDADRIAVAPATSVDEMLLNASTFMAENDFPPRLTVCTYAIQQARVQRHARALYIPVNSLTMNMPFGLHLANFTAEQWRLLWSS